MVDRISDAARTLRAKWSLPETKHEARHTILDALERTKGNAFRAASILEIGHRTILRYLEDPVIAARLEKIRDKAAAP